MPDRPSESEEWVTGRIASWVETYKKSMLTPVILHIIAVHQPATIGLVAAGITSATNWQITERGLYRTLKRLQDSGLLASVDVTVPRTGARRKELSLTSLGADLLTGITENLIELPDTNEQSSQKTT